MTDAGRRCCAVMLALLTLGGLGADFDYNGSYTQLPVHYSFLPPPTLFFLSALLIASGSL